MYFPYQLEKIINVNNEESTMYLHRRQCIDVLRKNIVVHECSGCVYVVTKTVYDKFFSFLHKSCSAEGHVNIL